MSKWISMGKCPKCGVYNGCTRGVWNKIDRDGFVCSCGYEILSRRPGIHD